MTSPLKRILPIAVLVLSATLPWAVEADELGTTPELGKSFWIWSTPGGRVDGGPVNWFRRKFVLAARPVEATIALTADNGYVLYVNNRRIAGKLGFSAAVWSSVERFRIEKHLVEGANVIAIEGESLGGAAGVVAAVFIRTADGSRLHLVTDASWLATAAAGDNWPEPDHDDSLWKPAVELASMGAGPWGLLSVPNRLTDPAKLVIDRSAPGGQYVPPRKDKYSEPEPGFRWPAGVVFVAGKGPEHSTPAQTTKWPIHGSRAFFEYDTPAPAASGKRLYAMTPARPDTPPRLLVDAGAGLVASPACDYDGREIVFAMVPEGEKFFKLFCIEPDGSGLRRLTTGPWHDFDPEFLPDGRIVFSSSRTGSRDEYHANPARGLFCLSADRTAIRPLTYHIVADSEPAVTARGRVAFVRHDNFLERAKVETHIHTIHPDGTAGEVLVGPDRGKIGYDRPTGAEDPHRWLRSFGFGCPAPLPDGRVACISYAGPLIARFSSREHVEMQRLASDVTPFDFAPLPDGRLLTSSLGGVLGILDPDSGKVVKLVEEKGVRNLFCEAPSGPCREKVPDTFFHSACYLGPRPRPPLVASHIGPREDQTHDKSGYLFCQRIFDTQQTDGDWQRVKAVRVFVGKPFTLRAARHQYGHVGVEGIELGTAPLAPDGSFYVRVPADRALAIQAVDAEGRPVVNSLSWIYVRPGERRSCVGCHNSRKVAPNLRHAQALAALARPVDLRLRGTPHRFRANNAANGGVLNQQMDRFREVASIDLYHQPVLPPGTDSTRLPPGRTAEVARLVALLKTGSPAQKVSAAQRLATFRDRAATPALSQALEDKSASVRIQAAMALAACGNRDAVAPLLDVLADPEPNVAQAAHMALSHLTGHDHPFNPYVDSPERHRQVNAWRAWTRAHDWDTIERDLVDRLSSPDPAAAERAIRALSHVGSEPAGAALAQFLQSGRTDSLVVRLAAIRALGHLRDARAVPLLAAILEENIVNTPVQPAKSHEFGWAAAPDHLAGAAAEALGWIGTPEAERRLIEAYGRLVEFWYYTFRTADHTWLMGCHGSIPHYRIAEALDAIGSRGVAPLTSKLLESVPMDPDRGLLYENDAYETVTARLIHRNGMGQQVVQTCLAVLGDPEAKGLADLAPSVTASPPAVSVGKLTPESRAAHLLSVVSLRPEDAPRVRAAFERFRAGEPSAERSWTCFFLARTLGKLRDRDSVAVLCSTLDDDPTEASFGIPDPPNVFLHDAWTPAYRAAAADALGRIGDRRAVPSLLAAVGDFGNSMEVRQAAADALRRIADPDSLPELERLADDYPEIATQLTLWEACAATRRARYWENRN